MIGNRLVSEQEFIDTLLKFGQAQTLEVYGKYGNKYTFDEVISYTNPYVERTIEASLGNITRALDNITKRLNPIDKTSLENIAQSISTLSSIVETKKASDTSLDNIDKTLSSLLENIKAIKASEEKIQRAISRKEKQTKTNN
jgi:ABC-type transporter Mla subunit MlaD